MYCYVCTFLVVLPHSVLPSARIVFVEPINRNSPTFETVRFGNPFSYNCTPTNQDRKLWTDRYKTPIQSSSDGRVVVTTGHTDNITINQATFEDAKEYYCYAFVYSLDESSPVIQERHLFRPVIIEGEWGCDHGCHGN